MTHFNKKRIQENSNFRTKAYRRTISMGTSDSPQNIFKSSTHYVYYYREHSEGDMTVVSLGADRPIPMVISVKGCLESWYKLIGCERIDIITAKIGDRHYDIILDDEALFKERLFTSAIDKDGNPMLMGNLVVCNFNDKGEETSLTDEDVTNILNHIRPVVGEQTDKPRFWTLLYDIEF